VNFDFILLNRFIALADNLKITSAQLKFWKSDDIHWVHVSVPPWKSGGRILWKKDCVETFNRRNLAEEKAALGAKAAENQ
jgi:hypothetical protein